ncbi:acyl-CoA dehydrogenase family protein [Alphaproteobacteria bacterium]|nr:acyl-CoA dehydrogenase family protein [Alphaproteobacteria bacterium]
MVGYRAPLQDLKFALREVSDFTKVLELNNFEAVSSDLIDAILEEAGKFASDSVASINSSGDKEGSYLENGIVRTPNGFKDAYAKYVAGGWNGMSFPEDIGGQGLPFALFLGVNEFFTSANMSFSLCPLLTTGAIEAMSEHASQDLKSLYLPKMLSGEWTGTMNLTEPHAGSDVGALSSKAVSQADGSYLIKGTKIYITYGDHDLSENIIHLVLARTPDSPSGTKGISLFLVPKFLVNEDGSLGEQNDLRCLSLEHKLGIKASPTAVMSFGENNGAKGWLVGELNQGMKCMFTMMNHARIGVGLQGLAIAERSYQQALNFAFDRKQGFRPSKRKEGIVSISEHPDVQRMILVMKSQIEAMRALILNTGTYYDLAKFHDDYKQKSLYQGLTDLLTPVVKAWCTDIGFECSSIGIQIHGGMGFIEETGAAQHMRDARIAPIYEGTNGIQALDLVIRKLSILDGEPIKYLISEMRGVENILNKKENDYIFTRMSKHFHSSINALEKGTEWINKNIKDDFDSVEFIASSYLKMFGYTIGGYYLIKNALTYSDRMNEDPNLEEFYKNKISIASFYVDYFLPSSNALYESIIAGSSSLKFFKLSSLEN